MAGRIRGTIEYCTLYNSTTDSGQFRRRDDLEQEGWTLGFDKIFRRGDEVALPLYEGQLVNRYDHRAKTYEGFCGPTSTDAPWHPRNHREQKANPAFEIEPRYWMDAAVVEARLQSRVGERAIFAFRDVGRPWREQRTAKGALIPRATRDRQVPISAVTA